VNTALTGTNGNSAGTGCSLAIESDSDLFYPIWDNTAAFIAQEYDSVDTKSITTMECTGFISGTTNILGFRHIGTTNTDGAQYYDFRDTI
jgi:hypothetical protein